MPADEMDKKIMVAIINAKTESMMRAIRELEIARAAWIHHCNAPAILAALWDCAHPERSCSHTMRDYEPVLTGKASCDDLDCPMFTSPGVGAAGYEYCTICGAARI